MKNWRKFMAISLPLRFIVPEYLLMLICEDSKLILTAEAAGENVQKCSFLFSPFEEPVPLQREGRGMFFFFLSPFEAG
jgi:hypothetical protein